MSGTKKLEAFDLPAATSGMRPAATIITPVAEVSPLTLQEARKSVVPEEPTSRAADREPKVEQLRTRLARKFTTLADEVTECFQDFEIGAGAWGAELTAPEGMSTNGGKHATQPLRLRPRRQGHPVLVGGHVDPVAKTAELRDYDYMLATHKARFGKELEITYDEWEQFLRKCEVVLQIANIKTTRVETPREVKALAQKQIGGLPARTAALIALAVIGPIALYVAWRVLAVLFS